MVPGRLSVYMLIGLSDLLFLYLLSLFLLSCWPFSSLSPNSNSDTLDGNLLLTDMLQMSSSACRLVVVFVLVSSVLLSLNFDIIKSIALSFMSYSLCILTQNFPTLRLFANLLYFLPTVFVFHVKIFDP